MNPALGGVSQAIRGMAASLLEYGCVSDVVCLDNPDATWIAKDAFTTHALGKGTGVWSRNPALEAWLNSHLGDYDAVIVHGLWLYHTYAARKAMSRRRKAGKRLPKMYVMPHGMLDPWFQKMSVRPVKAVRNWIFWKLLEHKVVNQADALLFTCEEEKIRAGQAFRPYRPNQQHIVGLGVAEAPAFQLEMRTAFAERCNLSGKPYILFLGRIHPKKGVDLLIKAWSELQKSQSKSQISGLTLVIAGPGLDSPFGAEMQTLAASECAPGTVHFPGMLSGDSKWGAFYGCEAFILPSHQENFGIAVVESLACGKPVLISNQVNIWREIVEGQGGYSADDTLQGTRELLRHGLEISKSPGSMASQAREVFQSQYDARRAAHRVCTALGAAKEHPLEASL